MLKDFTEPQCISVRSKIAEKAYFKKFKGNINQKSLHPSPEGAESFDT